MGRRAAAFDCERCLKFERPERQVIPVTAEIAHCSVAEIPPAIPFWARKINTVIRPLWRRSEPKIPIQPRRDRLRFCRAFSDPHDVLETFGGFLALSAPGASDPDVSFLDGPDEPALNEFYHAAIVICSVNLNAHLGGDFRLRCGFADLTRFPDIVGERLLAIDVL